MQQVTLALQDWHDISQADKLLQLCNIFIFEYYTNEMQ